ncbi:MAG: phospho-sugar mutase [Clostridiales bacterium]|nr:phospho-sugar mutase [Clostridiales bacterium]
MAMTAAERAKYWAETSSFDENTRTETQRILSDEQETIACFGAELTFGTGGLRGILGVGTNRMNQYTVGRATQGLADYLNANGGKTVAIAYDSRLRSDEFARIAAGILANNGLKAFVYPRLMPTPMLSYAVRHLHCDAGIVITASHNPAQYNGYKVYGSDGCQITQEAADAITACIEKVQYGAPQAMPKAEAEEKGLYEDISADVVDAFVEKTIACRVNPQEDTPLHLVYTPLHGTGLEPVTRVLDSMPGIRYTLVKEQCQPDGHFPTCPKPNPELREALQMGLDLAKKENASLLIATDPDSDRVGVAVRQKNGEYKVLTGNEVGLLLMEYVLKSRIRNGNMPAEPVIVKTIVTSDLAFAIAKNYGVSIQECLTGFKYIGEIIGVLEKNHQLDRYLFGFEESCGYLAGTHVRDKDAVMACMLVAEMAQSAAREGRTLADEMDSLYERYGFMENRLLNYDIAGSEPMKEMARTMENMRKDPPAMLAGCPVTVVKDYAPGIEGLPSSDVLSYAAEDGRKAIVRPSGTEPKVKIYLSARASTSSEAQAILDGMQQEMDKRILG